MPRTLATSLSALCLVLALGACGAWLKLYFFGLTDSNDYHQYVATAQYLSNEGGSIVPHRLLKPLNPLLIAGLATMMDYQRAFIFQAVVFYFGLIVAMYLLAKEFFEDRLQVVLVTSLVALSYPVLKYGIEINSETGAWFFYVLSLWLTVKFLKTPSIRVFIANALVVTIGFLWKEYSVVAAIIFGLSILFHSKLELQSKVRYILAYAAIFLSVHIPVQVIVYLKYHYSYFSWYMENAPAGVAAGELTPRTIVKSTAALLGLAWLAVPVGLMRYKAFADWQLRFFQTSLVPPMLGYTWGYISSRLLYVMAPPFVLVAGMGMLGWSRTARITFTAVVIAANIAWLFASYRVAL